MALTAVQLAPLRAEYHSAAALAQRLLIALEEQFKTVIRENDITLAVPIETRVKSFESVCTKIETKGRQDIGLNGITDLAGFRLITLFQRDVDKLDDLIRSILDVQEAENTAVRLDEAQFGYRSNHYVCRIPANWESIPSYKGLASLCAEVQLRTLPQHMWAAASHKLQYKREESAPPPLKRSINRVSAILEMVDLEFARILEERENYLRQQDADEDAALNVDNLSTLISSIFPSANRGDNERYDELLSQLKTMKVSSVRELRKIFEDGKATALQSESRQLGEQRKRQNLTDRVKRGVFFYHLGLAREAVRAVKGPLPGDSSSISRKRKPAPRSAGSQP